MGPESLYLIVLESVVASVAATYTTIPYGQYAGQYFAGYVYPTQSYTSNPAPGYQPYSPPGPYQPVYATPEAPKTPPSYSPPAYQPVFALPTSNTPSYPSYQPMFAPPATPAAPPYTPYQQSTKPPSPAIPANQPSYPAPITAPAAPSYSPSAYQQVYQSLATPPVVPTPPPIEPIVPYLPKEPLKSLPKPDLSALPPFDTNVLNNLAIALQLLIVSNLIHNPPQDSNPLSQLLGDTLPTVAPLPVPYIPAVAETPTPIQYDSMYYTMPNANFLGTAGFGDTGISKSMMSGYGSPSPPNPRSLGLMSPYDAIGPNSPYADFSTKKESKSPYHLSSDYKDLFSLTELFKV